ncbi:ferritin-like domain-containing protein [bacterium]|nr:ferritin-like domain-containing protein [bacterium]
MQLNNFGSILSFAEDLESKDEAFYSSTLGNSACSDLKALFEQNMTDAKKNIITIQRTRRENVTEMILEGIADFSSDSYEIELVSAAEMTRADVIAKAKQLEERAERYYLEAAEKIKALSEVARALKLIAKKRAAHKTRLTEL